jgi:hypothetical protein
VHSREGFVSLAPRIVIITAVCLTKIITVAQTTIVIVVVVVASVREEAPPPLTHPPPPLHPHPPPHSETTATVPVRPVCHQDFVMTWEVHATPLMTVVVAVRECNVI